MRSCYDRLVFNRSGLCRPYLLRQETNSLLYLCAHDKDNCYFSGHYQPTMYTDLLPVGGSFPLKFENIIPLPVLNSCIRLRNSVNRTVFWKAFWERQERNLAISRAVKARVKDVNICRLLIVLRSLTQLPVEPLVKALHISLENR